MKTRLSLILVLLSQFISSAQTVPELMNYQGILTDPTGVPLPDGEYALTFSIWENESGGSAPVWGAQVLPAVPLVNGRFNVVLGRDSNSVPISAAFTNVSPASYLEITVQGSTGPRTTILPRQRILSAPFALKAAAAEKADNADKLDGLKWDAVFSNSTTNRIPGNKIQPNSITASQIAPGTIGAGQITSGSIGAAQIADNSVGSAEMGPGAVQSVHLQLPLYLQSPNKFVAAIDVTGAFLDSPPPLGRQYGPALIAQNTAGGNRVMLSAGSDAGFFGGDVTATGDIYGNTKNFKIDHPLNPSNQYLIHTSVESPDMKNVYDGVAILDNNGEATVQLPSYFEALNKDMRYQLTPIGAAAPNLHVAKEISKNSFEIAGGHRGMKVSWQITGIRKDAGANAHRIQVEVDKPESERGFYIDPAIHGQPKEKSISEARRKLYDKTEK